MGHLKMEVSITQVEVIGGPICSRWCFHPCLFNECLVSEAITVDASIRKISDPYHMRSLKRITQLKQIEDTFCLDLVNDVPTVHSVSVWNSFLWKFTRRRLLLYQSAWHPIIFLISFLHVIRISSRHQPLVVGRTYNENWAVGGVCLRPCHSVSLSPHSHSSCGTKPT